MEEDNIIIDDYEVSEEQSDVAIETTVEVIEVEDIETFYIDTDDAFSALGEPNEQLRHQLLTGRDTSDQHPIIAITGLREELDYIESLKTVYSNGKQLADYYEWEDGNPLGENRAGYFVSICNDIRSVKICEGANIFGVIVDNAAFVGGQDDIVRDYDYGLVLYSGVADVRCELDVEVGSYVISNDYGVAKKSESGYGYEVVAINNKNGIKHATILLNSTANQMDTLGESVNEISERMDDAEVNIATAINVANEAYNKASEVISISENASQNASEAISKANSAVANTEQLGELVTSAGAIAAQARAISESAVVTAQAIQSEVVETANSALKNVFDTQKDIEELMSEINPLAQWASADGTQSGIVGFVARANADSATLATLAEWKEDGGDNQSIAGTIAKVNDHEAILNHITSHQGTNGSTIAEIEQKADDNGASITNLVASVDKYSVGEYSQAYGLSREQATSILKPGYIYIPTKHKDSTSHSEKFDENDEQWFTPGNYYVWDINDQGDADWIEYGGSVWISAAIPANSKGKYKYWYIDSATAPQDYEAYALYIWEGSKWKKVNTLAGNLSNRMMSMVRQTVDTIALDVVNAQGDISSHQQWLDSNGANVQDVVSWKSKVEKDVSQIATIKQTADDTSASIGLVVAKKNGEKVINAASIVTAINDSGDSSIVLDADHIDIANWSVEGSSLYSKNGSEADGKYTILKSNGNVTFAAGVPWGNDTNTTTGAQLQIYHNGQMNLGYNGSKYNVVIGRNGDVSVTGKITATSLTLGSDVSISKGTQSSDHSTSYFNVSANGLLTANNAMIYGSVCASTGYIGGENGWVITTGKISAKTGNASLEFNTPISNNSKWIKALNSSGTEVFYVEQKTGKLYAKNADIEGKIVAAEGYIGGANGWKIESGRIRSTATDGGEFWLTTNPSTSSKWIKASIVENGASVDKFYVERNTGKLYAEGAEINGKITANQGTIGGWTLLNGYLRSYTNNTDSTDGAFYLSSGQYSGTSSNLNNYWIYIYDTNGKIPFSLKKNGELRVEISNTSAFNWNAADVNSDGKINMEDARLILRAAVGLETLPTGKGDIDGDGKITAADTRLATRRAVGLEPDTSMAFSIGNEGLSLTSVTGTGSQATNKIIFYAGLAGVYAHELDTAVTTTNDSSSDINVKNNIELLTDDYDTLFDNLIPRRFKYNHGMSNRFHTGFIAQEIVEALEKSNLTTQDFATVVHLDTPLSNGAEWTLRKEEMVALNTWQIQKLKARVAELEEKIKRIEV